MKKLIKKIIAILLCTSLFYGCMTPSGISEISEESFDMDIFMEEISKLSEESSEISKATIAPLPPDEKEAIYRVFNNEIGDGIGFIKPDGTRISLGNDYDRIYEFSEGLAVVIKDLKRGAIDTEGILVIPLEYDSLGKLSNGLIPAEKNSKFGFLDATGEVKIPFDYDFAWDFSEGTAMVIKNEKRGAIDSHNNIIVPIEYEYLSSTKNARILNFSLWEEVWEPDNLDALKTPSFTLLKYEIWSVDGTLLYKCPYILKLAGSPSGSFMNRLQGEQGSYPIFHFEKRNPKDLNINDLYGIYHGEAVEGMMEYPVHSYQLTDEPVYKNVVEWDEDIPFDLVPLEESSEG